MIIVIKEKIGVVVMINDENFNYYKELRRI